MPTILAVSVQNVNVVYKEIFTVLLPISINWKNIKSHLNFYLSEIVLCLSRVSVRERKQAHMVE